MCFGMLLSVLRLCAYLNICITNRSISASALLPLQLPLRWYHPPYSLPHPLEDPCWVPITHFIPTTFHRCKNIHTQQYFALITPISSKINVQLLAEKSLLPRKLQWFLPPIYISISCAGSHYYLNYLLYYHYVINFHHRPNASVLCGVIFEVFFSSLKNGYTKFHAPYQAYYDAEIDAKDIYNEKELTEDKLSNNRDAHNGLTASILLVGSKVVTVYARNTYTATTNSVAVATACS